jgi:hypothetical protein
MRCTLALSLLLVGCTAGTNDPGFAAPGSGPISSDGGSSPTFGGAGSGDGATCDPGAYDFPGNGIDEDCDGVADNEPTGCDTGLAITGDDPLDAAKSLGICRMQSGKSWGLLTAKWTFPDGSGASILGNANSECDSQTSSVGQVPNDQSRGILPKFGKIVRPRQGASMVAMSSGIAREGFLTSPFGPSPYRAMMCRASLTPQGFPIDSPSCQVKTAADTMANDGMALELSIKVPTNVKSFSFDFDFFTYEWPAYVCDLYNDFFVALLTSQAPTTPANKNISFDSAGNPVSVNNALLRVCPGPATVGTYGQKTFDCPLGTAELDGTGFDPNNVIDFSYHAATSWLTTKADVVPGETITLRFAIWDTHDEQLDSTVLVDNFTWTGDGAGAPQTNPVTQ